MSFLICSCGFSISDVRCPSPWEFSLFDESLFFSYLKEGKVFLSQLGKVSGPREQYKLLLSTFYKDKEPDDFEEEPFLEQCLTIPDDDIFDSFLSNRMINNTRSIAKCSACSGLMVQVEREVNRYQYHAKTSHLVDICSGSLVCPCGTEQSLDCISEMHMLLSDLNVDAFYEDLTSFATQIYATECRVFREGLSERKFNIEPTPNDQIMTLCHSLNEKLRTVLICANCSGLLIQEEGPHFFYYEKKPPSST